MAVILILTTSRSMQRHVTRALAAVGHKPTRLGWDDRSQIKARLSGLDMCIVDADVDSDSVRWLLSTLRSEYPEVIPLIVSRDGRNPLLKDLLENHKLNNLVAKHGGLATGNNHLIDEMELIVTCEKLFRSDIFGIEKYLSTWATKIHSRQVRGTEDKIAAVNDLKVFLEEIDCFGAIKPSVALAADELLTNAMYNAPRNADGSPKYNERERNAPLELEPHEEVAFKYACDGRNIALSVRDQFGSLERQAIVKYLERCFKGEQGVMEEKKAGAGLGLYMVFSSITQLTFNIHVGNATEVIAIYYARQGAKGLHSSGRSLNIFLLQ